MSAVLDVIFVAFIELGSEHVACTKQEVVANGNGPVSYTHLRAHETR